MGSGVFFGLVRTIAAIAFGLVAGFAVRLSGGPDWAVMQTAVIVLFIVQFGDWDG